MWFADHYRGASCGEVMAAAPGGPSLWIYAVVPGDGFGVLHRWEASASATRGGRLRGDGARNGSSAGLAQHTGPRAKRTETAGQCRTQGRSRSGVAHARAAIRQSVRRFDPATRFVLSVAAAPWIRWWRKSRFAVPRIHLCCHGPMLTNFQNHAASQRVEMEGITCTNPL